MTLRVCNKINVSGPLLNNLKENPVVKARCMGGQRFKISLHKSLALTILEGAARYAGLLLAPADAFGRGLFLPKSFFISILGNILVIFGN